MMLQNSFGVQLSYASVDRGDGSDPRPDTRDLLRQLRVPAGLRDAAATWTDQQEAVVLIPTTDDGRVLALTGEDTISTELTSIRLREEFAAAGLTLWLDVGDDESFESDAPTGETYDHDSVGGDDAEYDPVSLESSPVEVASFSRRGPAVARALAQANNTPLEYLESGTWSLARFASDEPTGEWLTIKAELPVIEVNRAQSGDTWIEVTTSGGVVPFWLDAERGTQSVLDLDAITVPETVDICRRLLSEGDGSGDELAEVAEYTQVNVEQAHRALIAEAFGGTAGTRGRQQSFLAAFGIPDDLIDAALDGDTALDVRRFEPRSWPITLGEAIIDGTYALTPLTRRDRPLARISRELLRRPLLAAALSVAQLVLGLAASRFRGIGRVIGILMIVDSAADLFITAARRTRH